MYKHKYMYNYYIFAVLLISSLWFFVFELFNMYMNKSFFHMLFNFDLNMYEIYILKGVCTYIFLKILIIYGFGNLAIETYKKEISEPTMENLCGQSECSEQTTGECGGILDLFRPIKHSSTSLEGEEEEVDVDDEHESNETGLDCDDKNMKSEWLKSVQLWNQPDSVLSNKLVRFYFEYIFVVCINV